MHNIVWTYTVHIYKPSLNRSDAPGLALFTEGRGRRVSWVFWHRLFQSSNIIFLRYAFWILLVRSVGRVGSVGTYVAY
jgi:hypothetical protein